MVEGDSFQCEYLIKIFLQGNIAFKNDGDTVKVVNNDVLKTVTKLLQIDQKDFGQALLSRTVAARGEVMDKLLTHNEVLYARDAFAKVEHFPVGNKEKLTILLGASVGNLRETVHVDDQANQRVNQALESVQRLRQEHGDRRAGHLRL